MSKVAGYIPTWLRRKDEWEDLPGSARALWYWENVRNGTLPVASYIKQAADLFYKWMEEYTWCPELVDDKVNKVEDFYLPDGDKFDKFTCIPWQAALIAVMQGFKDSDGNRAANEILIVIPRKQGKTSLVAALALLEAAAPYGDAKRPHICVTAVNQDIARITHDKFEGIVAFDKAHNRNTGFAGKRKMNIEVTKTQVNIKKNGGKIVTLSMGAKSLQGYMNFMICADELSDMPDSKPLDDLRKGQGFSENSLLVMTSTTGARHSSALMTEMERFERVLNGEEEHMGRFPFMYRATTEDLAREGEPGLWEEVAPSLGWAEKFKFYHETYETARHDPIALDEFRTKLLCSISQAQAKFISVEDVLATVDPPKEPPRELCDRWFIGLDPADYEDFAALALLGVNMKTGKSYMYSEMFCPGVVLPGKDAVSRKAQRIRDAEADGYIQVHGECIDQSAIADRLIHLYNKYRPIAILSDPYQAIQEIQEYCKVKGHVHVAKKLRKLPKSGMHISEPLVWLVQQVKQKQMQVQKNPILLDHIGNTFLFESLTGARIPQKASKESLNKIDGVDAMLMACLGYTRSINMQLLGTPEAPIPVQYERDEKGDVTGVKPHRPIRVLGGR